MFPTIFLTRSVLLIHQKRSSELKIFRQATLTSVFCSMQEDRKRRTHWPADLNVSLIVKYIIIIIINKLNRV